MEKSCAVRFGSVTEAVCDIEINSVESIKNSASKLRMKKCFTEANVKTAEWCTCSNLEDLVNKVMDVTRSWKYKLVCKSLYGSRNRGNTLINNEDDLVIWSNGKNLENYIFEKYYNYSREYRLHITKSGCFYSCRKLLKEDTPDNQRWFKNSLNCVWILETNELFNKPDNWEEIVNECIKALKAIKLDVGACDVRVAKNTNDFKIIEINSAASFGDITLSKYLEQIPKIIEQKIVEKNGA